MIGDAGLHGKGARLAHRFSLPSSSASATAQEVALMMIRSPSAVSESHDCVAVSMTPRTPRTAALVDFNEDGAADGFEQVREDALSPGDDGEA